jgi:Sec-independent protein translocase protein TatA
MISLVGFLLFTSLLVFGPKKTIEFAQEAGRWVAHLKDAAGQFQRSAMATEAPARVRPQPPRDGVAAVPSPEVQPDEPEMAA